MFKNGQQKKRIVAKG